MILQEIEKKIISNLTWVLLDYKFIVFLIMNCYHHINSCMCIHVDSTTLADGTYELVPESENEQREAQVNLTEVAEDPNQSSEEPKTNYAEEGKPRSMTYYFQLYATYCFYILVHLSLQELIKTLVAWS